MAKKETKNEASAEAKVEKKAKVEVKENKPEKKSEKKAEKKIEAKPVGIMETVLRDAHQSLIATRMPTEVMLPIVETMDQVGYHAVECWGGATFDASLRFLKEDPWDRLRKLRD